MAVPARSLDVLLNPRNQNLFNQYLQRNPSPTIRALVIGFDREARRLSEEAEELIDIAERVKANLTPGRSEEMRSQVLQSLSERVLVRSPELSLAIAQFIPFGWIRNEMLEKVAFFYQTRGDFPSAAETASLIGDESSKLGALAKIHAIEGRDEAIGMARVIKNEQIRDVVLFELYKIYEGRGDHAKSREAILYCRDGYVHKVQFLKSLTNEKSKKCGVM